MQSVFLEMILKPVISFLSQEAIKIKGQSGTVAEMEEFVIAELEKFLQHFTQATTQPTQFMHDFSSELKNMISSALPKSPT
jgi:hypothetical protein